MENIPLININKLPELLNHEYTFIDLREPNQFNQLHLTKFINIPYDKFNPTKLNLPKNKPIYLICYSGKKSLALAKQLNIQGFHAYSFNGGFYAIEHPINTQYY